MTAGASRLVSTSSLLFCCLVLTSSCDDPANVTFNQLGLVVWGEVVGPDGEPAPDVDVQIDIHNAECTPARLLASGSGTTGPEGRYRARVEGITSSVGQLPACLAIRFVPPSDVNLAPDSLELGPVTIRRSPPDSVGIDRRLAPKYVFDLLCRCQGGSMDR